MFTHGRWAAGLALLAALVAGCGSAAHSSAPTPAGHHQANSRQVHSTVTAPPAPAAKAPAHSVNPIPQGNGGDQDADNNGGPTDGDGNI